MLDYAFKKKFSAYIFIVNVKVLPSSSPAEYTYIVPPFNYTRF